MSTVSKAMGYMHSELCETSSVKGGLSKSFDVSCQEAAVTQLELHSCVVCSCLRLF